MLWLIKLLFFGKFCKHSWKVRDEFTTNIYSDNIPVSQIKEYILQCENCGDLKRKKFKN